MADEIVKARVWTKVDTLENWNNNPLLLGPGEMALVTTPSGIPINMKWGDKNERKRFSDLPFAISYDQGQFVAIGGPGALPTPESDVAYSLVGPGTYTYPGQSDIIVGEVRWGQVVYSDGEWSFIDMGELPFDPNAVQKNEIDIPGGVVGFDTFSKVTVVSSDSVNIVSPDMVEFGYINSTIGGYIESQSWLRIPYFSIPEEIKGTYVNVSRSGEGGLGSGGNLVSFRDSNGYYMPDESIEGAPNFPKDTQVLVPEEASTWGFTLINSTSIGADPVNNQYAQGFSVTSEGVEEVLLDETKINNPDNIVFENEITETGTGAVPSRDIFSIKSQLSGISDRSSNLADTMTTAESGFWSVTGGQGTSDNWMRISRFNFPASIVDRLEDGESLYLWIFGGGSVGSSGASAVFWDEFGAVVSGQAGEGTATFPVRIAIPQSARSMASTVANEVGIGVDPMSSPYIGSFYIGLEVQPGVQPDYQPYGFIIKTSALPDVPDSSVDTSEIILRKVAEDMFHIYFHAGGREDLWFRVNLRRQTNVERFIDVWRIEYGYIVSRSGDSFLDVREVVMQGVYENAIYVNGYSDALGSAHGWEIFDEFNIWMDGSVVDLSAEDFTDVVGSELNFTALSYLKSSDGLSDVGKSFKRWTFKNGVFNIKNTINWLSPLQVASNGRSFLALLSIKRDDAQGNITHSAQSNEDGITYDVSVSGFTTPIFSDSENPSRHTITIWGDDIRAEVSMDRFIRTAAGDLNFIGMPNAGMYVQNSELYNKVYGTMGTASIQPGDLWESNSIYKFRNSMS